jgi:YidC/Oxa1 family membrane protein insertase
MDLLAITLSAPTGLWQSVIFGMERALGNYAVALILVTIIIKLVMVPFDFVNKFTSKKSARKQAEMKPDLDKVNAKYANDKNMLNQKTMEVYKSHNYNVMGTCLGMVIYLVFTMVVFWTLFGALNNISYYKIGDQFLQVRQEYFAAYGIDVNDLDDNTTALSVYKTLSAEDVAAKVGIANEKALAKYDETKTSFLWIENIWLPDTTKNPVMSYDNFIEKSSLDGDIITEEEYNLIMDNIKTSERKTNGYFLLAILAAGLNFLSIYINNIISRKKAIRQGVDPKLTANGSNKVMTIIMPLIMGIFTLFYNAAFGLYIVSGALITLITSPLVTLFVDMLEIEAIKKEQTRTVASYDRRRKK